MIMGIAFGVMLAFVVGVVLMDAAGFILNSLGHQWNICKGNADWVHY